MVRGFAGEMIVLRDDGNNDAISRLHLFDVGDAFFIESDGRGIGIVACGQNYYRKIFVDQRIGAVLHFASGIAFGVDVGNFLQLESSFERNRIMNATAEIEKIGAAEKL